MAMTIETMFAFLLGEGEIDGCSFGDTHPTYPGKFWWRAHLRSAMENHLSAQAKVQVPDVIVREDDNYTAYENGWNACREEMILFLDAFVRRCNDPGRSVQAERDTANEAVSFMQTHGAELIALLSTSRLSHGAQSSGNSGEVAQGEVALPDPWSCNACTHPDCGRYNGPRQVECRAMRDNACAREYQLGHPAEREAVPEYLKDPENAHALMLRGAIAVPSIRSMVSLRGEVPNGEDAQLARIAELQEQLAERAAVLDQRDAEIARLNAIINTPQSDDFLRAVSIEAEHQRQRWGKSHDSGKEPSDWFWLIGYLAGKALHAHAAGNVEKAEHHVITTAAACANWHRAMFGKTDMRPGIDGEAALSAAPTLAGKGGAE
jgi:hypothetical protein